MEGVFHLAYINNFKGPGVYLKWAITGGPPGVNHAWQWLEGGGLGGNPGKEFAKTNNGPIISAGGGEKMVLSFNQLVQISNQP